MPRPVRFQIKPGRGGLVRGIIRAAGNAEVLFVGEAQHNRRDLVRTFTKMVSQIARGHVVFEHLDAKGHVISALQVKGKRL